MLKGLEEIKWNTLHHAYGVGSNIPILLQQIAEGSDACDELTDELAFCLTHQGDMYEATVLTIPFLIELLKLDTVRCKGKIVSVLFILYHQDNTSWFLPRFYRRARVAIRQGFELYMALMQIGPANLQTALSELITCFSIDPLRVVSVLHQALQENTDTKSSAVMIRRLNYFVEKHLARRRTTFPAVSQTLLHVMQDKMQRNDTRLWAARALATFTAEQLPLEAKQMLMTALISPLEFDFFAEDNNLTLDTYTWLRPSCFYKIAEIVCQALEQAKLDPKFVRRLRNVTQIQFTPESPVQVAESLISSWFKRGATSSALSFHQQLVLASLLNSQALWSEDDDDLAVLQHYGLPTTRGALRQLLGL